MRRLLSLLAAALFLCPASSFAGSWVNPFYPNPGTSPGAPLVAMSAARSNHTLTVLPNGNIVVLGGQAANGTYLNTGEIFVSTAGIWVNTAPMSVARTSHTATLLASGDILVAGGFNGAVTATAELYHPLTNTWQTLTSLSNARANHSATLLQNGTVLVAGGNSGATFPATAEIYDPASGVPGAWTQVAFPMNEARASHTATLLSNGVVWVAGGTDQFGNLLNSTELYYPSLAAWAIGQPLVVGRAGHQATILGTGDVLISGGIQSPTIDANGTFAYSQGTQHPHAPFDHPPSAPPYSGYSGTTEVYKYLEDRVEPAGQLSSYRSLHTANRLADGTVMLAGGYGTIDDLELAGETVQGAASINFGAVTTLGASFTAPITGGTIQIPADELALTQAHYGQIINGAVSISSAQITLSSGTAYFAATAVLTQLPVGDTAGAGFIAGPITLNLTGGLFVLSTPTAASPMVGTSNVAVLATSTDSALHVDSFIFADAELMDASDFSWALRKDPLTSGRYAQKGAVLQNGDLVLTGGWSLNSAGVVASTTSNEMLSSLVGNFSSLSASLSVPRSAMSVTPLPDGRVLVAGGSNGSSILKTCELYNPVTKTWSATGSMAVARHSHSAVLLPNGNVLVAGGTTVSGSTSTAEIYYTRSGTWHQTAPMKTARVDHTATLLYNGNVLVTGGHAQTGPDLKTSEVFVSTMGLTGGWNTVASMSSARSFHGATAMPDGTLLVTGGVQTSTGNVNVLNSVEAYNPQTNAWTTRPALGHQRFRHSAVSLLGGDLLVAFGADNQGPLPSNQIFDHVSNTWSSAFNGLDARFSHTAALLPNAKVLIAGGNTGVNTRPSNLSLFDTIGRRMVVPDGNNLRTARSGHGQALLADNNLLIIGGRTSQDLSSVETCYYSEYAPSAQSPAISSLSGTAFTPGQSITVLGSNFTAGLEQGLPMVTLQTLDSGGGGANFQSSVGGVVTELSSAVFNASTQWSNISSSMTFNLPASTTTLAPGWYRLRVLSAGLSSSGAPLQLGPALPPTAVTGLAATVHGTSSMTFSWAALAGADGYDVYSATTSDILLSTSATSVTFTGLTPNTPVSLQVAAYTLLGDGPLTTASTVYSLALPPASLSVTSASFNTVGLSFVNTTTPGTLLELSVSTDNFLSIYSQRSFSSVGSTQSYTVDNLAENTLFYFRIRDFNGSGLPSGYSNVVSSYTLAHLVGLTGAGASPTSIQWNWTAVGNALGYNIYQSPGGAFISSVPANVFVETGLSTNTSNSIIVAAVTPSGQSALSSAATTYTLAAPPVPDPTNPVTRILDSSGTAGDIQLQWLANGNPDPTLYIAEASCSSCSSGLRRSSTTLLNVNFRALDPNSLYVFSVAAVNYLGLQTSLQFLGSTPTLANPPAALQVASISNSFSTSSVLLTWDANRNPSYTDYQVLMSTDGFALNLSTPVAFGTTLSTTSFLVEGLAPATIYAFRVSARNLNNLETTFLQVSTVTPGAIVGPFSGVTSTTATVTFTGEFLSFRRLSVTVPPESFNRAVSLQMFESSSSVGCGTIPAGFSVVPTPSDQPQSPVTVTYTFNAGDISGLTAAQKAELTLARFDPVSSLCVPVPTQVDVTGHKLTAYLNHFSQFQVMVLPPKADLSAVRVYPNPFYPSRHQGYITFDRMTADGHVQVFTLTGELVYDGKADAMGVLTWDGNNAAGNPVASGVYVALIRSAAGRRIEKLAVER